MLVFDESEADVSFSILAEADTGRHPTSRFLKKEFRESERAELQHRRRQRHPSKHRSWRRWDAPPCPVQRFDEAIPPALIGLAHFLDTLLRPIKRGRGSHLDGCKS